MHHMRDNGLKTIAIEGFTSIRSASVELGPLNVLIGANGAGKSNFIHAFEMLGRIADRRLSLFVGRNGGASALLNTNSSQIRLRVAAHSDDYEIVLGSAVENTLILEKEVVTYADGANRAAVALDSAGNREAALSETLFRELLQLIRGCRVFHFHDTSIDAPVKQHSSTADNLALHTDAANLASVLYELRNSVAPERQAAYRRIVGAINLVAPFFDDFVLQPVPSTDNLLLRWREKESDTVFSANQMSDGTLRFACLATLLLHPELPAVVVLDEPELGLHPFAIIQLAGMLKQASARSQVVFATQSVTLMNQFEVEDLLVVDRQDGASTLSRPDAESLQAWLDDYTLGELWEKNLIGGRPSSVVPPA